ncbi:MAG TPA: hypothetical protein VIH35_07070, partial [Kiritimatiellia bacterium]
KEAAMNRCIAGFGLALLIGFAAGREALGDADRGLGIGIIIGEPTGLSIKNWLDDKHAIDAAAAWSLDGDDMFRLHADYLWHNFGAIKNQDAKAALPVYYGIGARVRFEDDENGNDDEDTTAGIRFPVGIDIIIRNTPIDVFGEIVPVMELVPETDLDFDAGIGLRYFFN